MSNYFSKNNRSSWVIGFLILLNVLTLSTLWFSKGGRGHRGHKGGDRVAHFFADKLDLSKEQKTQFKEQWEAHRTAVKTIKEKTKELREARMDLLIQANPDVQKLNDLAQKMGQQQVLMEQELSAHYTKLSAVCNEAQRVKLGEVFKKMMKKRGGKKGKKGRGKHGKDN